MKLGNQLISILFFTFTFLPYKICISNLGQISVLNLTFYTIIYLKLGFEVEFKYKYWCNDGACVLIFSQSMHATIRWASCIPTYIMYIKGGMVVPPQKLDFFFFFS